jgi:hypothetical protein
MSNYRPIIEVKNAPYKVVEIKSPGPQGIPGGSQAAGSLFTVQFHDGGGILSGSTNFVFSKNTSTLFIVGGLRLFGFQMITGSMSVTGSVLVSGSNGAGLFSKGGTLYDDTFGISSIGSFNVWRAPYPCKVVKVYGRKVSGGIPEINARKSGSDGYQEHLASNLLIENNSEWTDGGSTINEIYNPGDSLEIIVTGSLNTEISVQVDFIKI